MSSIPKSLRASTAAKFSEIAAARPDAGEKEVFMEVCLKTEEERDLPNAIPNDASAKETEKDMLT